MAWLGERRSGAAAFRSSDYRYYWLARMLGRLAIEVQITTVSWQVFDLTGDPLDLGLVGLAQFAPFLILFLVAGAAADRYPRTRILLASIVVQTVCAVALFTVTISGRASFGTIFAILVVLGITRAFQAPSLQAIVPALVPTDHFANAVAWTVSGIQVARITGPGIAGLLIILGEEIAYATVIGLFVLSVLSTAAIKAKAQVINRERVTLATVLAGFRFVWSRQVILGAISLDLLAVLLGGATALLPIFAVDILGVGAVGFGVLRASHMVGSFMSAILLTQLPIRRHAGRWLLSAVALFGAATCLFGLSKVFWLSVAALFTLGAADAISVFVRNNLVLILTPDDMRGRVSAITSVFIGASNELGEFESGITAAWWGAVTAVLVGGLGTVAVAAVFTILFPRLRGIDSLDPGDLMSEETEASGRAPPAEDHPPG